MKTLGYTTIGATSAAKTDLGIIFGARMRVPYGSKRYIASVNIALSCTTDISVSAKAGLYVAAAGGTFITGSETEEKLISLTSTPTWFQFNYATPFELTQGQLIAPCVWIDNAGAATIKMYYDAGDEYIYYESSAYAAAWANIAAWDTAASGQAGSIYVSYRSVYCSQNQVETWAHLAGTELGLIGSAGMTYADSIFEFSVAASRAIDQYLEVPEDFFLSGGVEFTEVYDGVELGWSSNWVDNPYSNVSVHPLLRLHYNPVVSIESVEEKDSSGSWTALTEGTDYIASGLGVRFMRHVPAYNYGNVRVTYMGGYASTPRQISAVAAQLTASIIQRVLMSQKIASGSSESYSLLGVSSSNSTSTGATDLFTLASACFTEGLKKEINQFRSTLPPRAV